jgi:predicted phage terminase large subunit-like protein
MLITKKNNEYLDINQFAEIIDDPVVRREVRKTFKGFCLVYLAHYFFLPPADFHEEMMNDLEDPGKKFIAIEGFRGSAKSTIASLAFILYSVLEKKEPFVIPINETDDIVKLTIANIRAELEGNELIIADYGNQISKQKGFMTKFAETNIVLKNGSRIMGRSRGQKIRGLRHRQFRPSLVVIDDPEEREKVQKKEYRDKTERWLLGDIIPAIEESSARLIVIGNVLHTDSLLARLKNHPLFLHRSYPLITSDGRVTWKGKYPTPESIKRQEEKVGRTAWLREYLLKVIPPEGQEVKEEWINYYDEIEGVVLNAGCGVDPAISKSETADFTAMVSGVLCEVEGRPRIYIMPNPVNMRLSLHETIQMAKSIDSALSAYAIPTFFWEDVAYQRAGIEEAQAQGISALPVKVGKDKRARLKSAAIFIQNGTVLFPRKGCEDLIGQLLGFGVEDHDDLVDAFVYLVLGLAKAGFNSPEAIAII